MIKLNEYEPFGISASIQAQADLVEARVAPVFADIDRRCRHWQLKTIGAFQHAGVAESAYQTATGYGYGDRSREQTEVLFADLFDADSALVRIQFSSGTHVLATMLRGLLAGGDELLIASGRPYDTLLPLLGLGAKAEKVYGSLPETGVVVKVVPLLASGDIDLAAVASAVTSRTRLVYLQKSRGYTARRALPNKSIRKLRHVLDKTGRTIDMAIDFCYGEYVEMDSPLTCGANVIAGSLIKNPGAGIAPTGGYIAGDRGVIERIESAMTAPGVGGHIGPQLGFTRRIQQGLYFAPQVTAAALKTAVFAAATFADAGYAVSPLPDEARADIVQRIAFGDEKYLIRFCQAVQKAAPVDSYVTPIPAPMPGYDCDIIMASGAFIAGSSIELSADGPLRPPYAAYLQGGLTFENGRLAVMLAKQMVDELTNS